MEGDGSFDAKRRIAGAAILVTAAVVILPIVLRQPPSPAGGGQVLTVRRVAHGVQVVVKGAPVTAGTKSAAQAGPVSAPVAPSAASAAKPPVAVSLAKARGKPTAQSRLGAPARAAVGSPVWYVQVGAYVQAVDGITLKHRLKAQGFPAHVELTRLPSGRGVVVIVGPYGRAQAQGVRQEVARRDRVHGFLIREAAAAR